jgi:transposase-like protein
MTLSVPRDRVGTFDPNLIAKYQRRFLRLPLVLIQHRSHELPENGVPPNQRLDEVTAL